MNLTLNISHMKVFLSSAQIEQRKLEAEYKSESRELVVMYQPPDQAIQVIVEDEGSATLQIHQIEVHLSDEAIRHLAASLPPDVLKQ